MGPGSAVNVIRANYLCDHFLPTGSWYPAVKTLVTSVLLMSDIRPLYDAITHTS